MDLVGSYRCDCKTGYSGNDCQTSENSLRGFFISKKLLSREHKFIIRDIHNNFLGTSCHLKWTIITYACVNRRTLDVSIKVEIILSTLLKICFSHFLIFRHQ